MSKVGDRFKSKIDRRIYVAYPEIGTPTLCSGCAFYDRDKNEESKKQCMAAPPCTEIDEQDPVVWVGLSNEAKAAYVAARLES